MAGDSKFERYVRSEKVRWSAKRILGTLCVAGLSGASVTLAEVVSDAGENSSPPGKAVYDDICAHCHEAGVPRAPSQKMLYFVAPPAMYRALTEGVMVPMAAGLTDKQKVAAVEYLTDRKLVLEDGPDVLKCEGKAARFDYDRPPKSTGWGMTHGNTREVPSEVAGITRDNVQNLKLQWAFGFPETTRMRSQPTVAGGGVYGGSQGGYVYFLCRHRQGAMGVRYGTGIHHSVRRPGVRWLSRRAHRCSPAGWHDVPELWLPIQSTYAGQCHVGLRR